MSQAIPPTHYVPPVFRAEYASAKCLVHLIPDQLAKHVPDHPLFSYPKSVKPENGFHDVLAKDFANAINRVSWYLARLLGPPKEFDTVAYIGSNDIRYFLLMFGAMKVGYKMLFLSPRNNLESHLNVLQGVDCNVFLRSEDVNVNEILSKRPMHCTAVPELTDLLHHMPVESYPYKKSFEEAWMDPCLVLHTTGSTGLPKPITWNAGIFSTYEAWRTVPHVDGYVPTTEIYQQSRRAYTSMPLFHTSGLNAGITWSLLCGVTLVYGDPHMVPNASYTDEMHKHAGVDASMGAPSIYEELCHDSAALERLHRLHYIVASGAPLSRSAGDIISKHTRVIGNLGATETACLQRLAPSINDWPYFYWHPSHSGIEMRETVDGLYELFLVKSPGLELYQGVFNTFPEIDEWSMNDLYSRHPDPKKPFLWIYRGRKDDVIVLSNGEKIAPALIEATLLSDPLVKGVMVAGRGRFQPALIIDLAVQPPRNQEERMKLIERLMPTIDEANVHTPAHGKLDRYHILFATPNKPISYLGQGKIQRLRTYATFEKDLEELYRSIEDGDEQAAISKLPTLEFRQAKDIEHWLRQLIIDVAGIDNVNMDHDLFMMGIDSLQVIKMARELRFQAKKAKLGKSQIDNFQPAAVYKNPTLNQLKDFILQQVGIKPRFRRRSSRRDFNGLIDVDPPIFRSSSTVERMQVLLHQHVSSLPRAARAPSAPSSEQSTILLTGSTGSLGSYLLDTLQQNANVARIICLNRGNDAAERQQQMAMKRGLTPIDTDRVGFFKADLSKAQLGLEGRTYDYLRENVTHIIHNQWPVNFNWVLSSFAPFLTGVQNLIRLSHSSQHNAFLLFISSVSAVGNWKGSVDAPSFSGLPTPSPTPGTLTPVCQGGDVVELDAASVPENVTYDLSVAGNMGYGQSKLLSECLLDQAARISGVRSAVCRVGVVAGPVERAEGEWNRHEYIPSIFISSAHLLYFPSTFPSRDRIDWLPVDKLSVILTEILFSASSSSSSLSSSSFTTTAPTETILYNVTSPSSTSWSTLSPYFRALYPKHLKIQPLPFESWIDRLAASTVDGDIDAARNPGVKLLEFYRRSAEEGKDVGKVRARYLDTRKAEEASQTLRDLYAEDGVGEWVGTWMGQWGLREI